MIIGQNIPNGRGESTRTTIAAYDGPLTVTVLGSINWATGSNSQYITVDGFSFDGTNLPGEGTTVYIGGNNSHIRLINFEAKNTALATSPTLTGNGVGVAGSFNEFINCSVHHNGLDTASASSGYGFYINGSDHLIERCRIYHNGGYGIHAFRSGGGADRITIRYNEIYDNSVLSTMLTAGVIVSSGSGHKVYGNIVRNEKRVAIQVYDTCGDCVVYNNTVYGSQYGTYITGTRTILKNNIFFQNSGGNILNDGVGTIQSNNLTSNPLFVDASSGDFHIQSGSPAIDAGITLTEVSTGIDGTPRPQGAAYDIGAYEYR